MWGHLTLKPKGYSYWPASRVKDCVLLPGEPSTNCAIGKTVWTLYSTLSARQHLECAGDFKYSSYLMELNFCPRLVRSCILWLPRARQSSSRLALELYGDGRDSGIGRKCEDDSPVDEVEISKMPRPGFVELNPDRHFNASEDSARK